ncbi:interferon-induced, double-stranded RNA-activated kinase [Paramuricea clavata]|uniref:Interferon-induced, double-stranded RNA-activated kinase n=1 Tax=Paramuricea clavata TaxID=317549 RepID=A0A7D9MCT3_PARCT|nr:interferon-induced, double-stranded RNA-activated kinase [Paramuricea clavata]
MNTTDNDATLYAECGKALSNKYEVDGTLGKGAFGQVFKVKCKDNGKPYAIKMLPINKIQGAKYEQREVEALTKFQNRSEESKRNVIEHFKAWILYVCDVETLAIQMELCWVNLHTFVIKNKIDGPKIIQAEGPPRFYQQVFRQILDGLVFIHSMYWVHRDIHPGNILIVNPNPQRINDIHVKIADFGLARYVGTTFDLSSDGTINLKSEELTPFACDSLHTAPELNTKTYDFKVDVYSAGMVLYFISCFPVLESSELKEEIKAIRRGERDINKCIYHKDDKKLSSLMKQMLEKNPNERPSASDAKKYMFPEATDSTDGKKAQNIKFFARKKNEDLRTCSIASSRSRH